MFSTSFVCDEIRVLFSQIRVISSPIREISISAPNDEIIVADGEDFERLVTLQGSLRKLIQYSERTF